MPRFSHIAITAITAITAIAVVAGAFALNATVYAAPSLDSRSSQSSAAANEVSLNGDVRISYADWDVILGEMVWYTGLSDRRYAKRAAALPGTRLTASNDKPTRLEANKVMFHMMSDKARAAIPLIRQNMERLPSEVPLETLSSDEQLAYWLNLRNAAVFDAVAAAYPITNLRNFMAELEQEKLLNVAGRAMSIRDIELLVMERWPTPLVAYGFYMGNIGSPSLTTEAFTGANVWDSLKFNAKEFVTSLRGVQFREDRLRVSTFYEHVAPLFPNFERDVKAHILEYATEPMKARIYTSNEFTADVEDWHIADLFNGKMHTPGDSGMNNPAAFVLSAMPNGQLAAIAQSSAVPKNVPPHVQALITEIFYREYRKFKRNGGNVYIDEVSVEESEESAADPLENANPIY